MKPIAAGTAIGWWRTSARYPFFRVGTHADYPLGTQFSARTIRIGGPYLIIGGPEMARHRVVCVLTHEKNEGIISLGCYTTTNLYLTLTEAQVIDMIENQGHTFYVERPTGHVVDLEVVKEHSGKKYVKTKADGERPDNLLSLPRCPAKKPTAPVLGSLGTVLGAASHGAGKW